MSYLRHNVSVVLCSQSGNHEAFYIHFRAEVLIEQCQAVNESTRWSVAGPTFTKKRRWNMAGEATNSTLLFQLTWRPLRALDFPRLLFPELQRA